VLDADNQLSQLQTDLTTKATSMKGKDALAAGPQVDQDWQKAPTRSGTRSPTIARSIAFENRVGSRYSSSERTGRAPHADRARATTTIRPRPRAGQSDERRVDNYQDPAKVDGAIAETKAILADKAQARWLVTGTAASGDDRSRQQGAHGRHQYDAGQGRRPHRFRLLREGEGSDRGRRRRATLQKALEEGSVRGESQRQADQITPSSPIGSRRSTKRRS
jgi:hypothetical protein